MRMRVRDVRGDGHCYYRCVWQVAKNDSRAFEALCLVDETEGGNQAEDEETEGAIDVRFFVVMSLRHDPNAIDVLRRLLLLAEESSTDHTTLSHLKECYPILASPCTAAASEAGAGTSLTRGIAFDVVLARVRDEIENAGIYASSFEHEIVSGALSKEADLRLLVLCRESEVSKEDLADKWLRQLNKQLPHVSESRVAVLVNHDNVHYMYVTWRCGSMVPAAEADDDERIVLSTRDLVDHVNLMMAMESESESGEGEFLKLP